MSNNDILYVKGMNLSESELEEEDVMDIWDDSKLNDAYDKALRIANAEVAKRVAMSTNTQPSSSSNKDDTKSKPSQSKQQSTKSQKKDKTKWKAGMHCRAVYEADGIEYEALLLRVINNTECVVRFLGYENSEIVPISELKPSLGKTERTHQIEEALVDKLQNGDTNNLSGVERMDCNDRSLSPGSTVSFQKSKKSGKKKNKQKQNGFQFPEVPMPNLSQLRNLGGMDMPMPPPPLGLRSETDSEEQAISSMLLSWYMSGYYTGLYQGMKRAKEGRGSH